MTPSYLTRNELTPHDTSATRSKHTTLTIVVTVLAVAREVQARIGASLRRIVLALQPLQSATVHVNAAIITVPANTGAVEAALLDPHPRTPERTQARPVRARGGAVDMTG